MSELHEVDRRLAVLEQIARDTAAALADIRAELRLLRTELTSEVQGLRGEFQGLRSEIQGLRNEVQQQGRELRADFRWLLRFVIGGFVGMFALLAHGLHWF